MCIIIYYFNIIILTNILDVFYFAYSRFLKIYSNINLYILFESIFYKFCFSKKEKKKRRRKNKNTCVLSCSELSLKVVVIFRARFFAFTKPYENKDISAMRA